MLLYAAPPTYLERPATELVHSSLMIIGALFPLVNSPENIPVFLALTPGVSDRSREILARKIAVNSLLLLVASVLIGTHILAFFGISLPAVQVGGGLVLVAAGWQLLNRPDDDGKPSAAGAREPSAAYLTRRAFYPLTMPLTVGPGSVSVAIAVGANHPAGEARFPLLIGALMGCVLLAATVYLLYRFAESIGSALGDSAMSVIVRLSAFILLCIGVQIVWNGVSALERSLR